MTGARTCPPGAPGGFHTDRVDAAQMVGDSAAMRELRRQLTRIARSRKTILLIGERGTGKSLAAQAIHLRREGGRLLSVPSEEIEPDVAWPRLLAETAGGTLFVARLEHLGFQQQAALVHTLETRRANTRGAPRTAIVVSLRAEPDELARDGLLRPELVDAFAGGVVRVPPLRDRREDIPDLVASFLGGFCRRRCACLDRVTPAALSALAAYDWPGNVRELRQTIDQAVVHGQSSELDVWDLPPSFHSLGGASSGAGLAQGHLPVGGLKELPTLAELEQQLILEAVRRANGNKSEAARALGISRHKLYDALREQD